MKVLTNNQYYSDIADTIRQMKGVATTYKPREMASALRDMYSTEVEGVPPLTFPSNGNNLLNYRIDGTSSGVGDRTKNLANDNDMLQGYWSYADGTYIRTDTWICTPKIACKGNVGYTFQFANNSRWYGFVWYGENGNYISTSNIQNTSSTPYRTYTATSPSNARYLVINIAGYPGTNDTIRTDDLINFQLEESSTVTDYEPYGYKIPAIISGKNLMPPISEWVDGFISGSGVISAPSATNKEKTSPFIPVELNKRYAFSFYPNAGQPWRCVATYDENKNYIARPYSSYTSDPIFFTPSGNVKYLRFSYRTYGDGTYSQLEQNNEVTNYEPYTKQITNIYLDEPIGANESKSLSDTNVNIPTINGTNILSIDTTVQPSNVYVQAPKTNNYNL